MTRASLLALLLLPAAFVGVPACAGEDAADPLGGAIGAGGGDRVCAPNRQVLCTCMDGLGYRTCLLDGSGWTDCNCGEEGGSGGTGPCGDGLCLEADDENCHSCAADCGACAPCDIASQCENTMIPPDQMSHQAELDIPAMTLVPPEQIADRIAREIASGSPAMRLLVASLDSEPQVDEHPIVTRLRAVFASNPEAADKLRAGLRRAGIESLRQYRDRHPIGRQQVRELAEAHAKLRSVAPSPRPAGAISARSDEFPLPMVCGAPYLRIAVSEIYVREDYDDMTNDKVYCVLQAEAQAGGEIRVTPMTPALDEGESYTMSLAAGAFWGQLEPRDPEGEILVTYDCIESDDDDAYANVLAAVGEAAVDIGGAIPGEAGLIIMVVGIIAEVVAGIWAMDGDDPIFNAQHTIAPEFFYPMTRGVYWTVRRADDGGTFGSAFDWELIVKGWGCAEYGTLDAS